MGEADDDDRGRDANGILHPEGMRAARDLAIGVVHEINNVLGVILGNTHLVSKNLTDTVAVERYVGEVRGAAEEAREIMRQLSALTGEHSGSPRIVSLNDLVHPIKNESSKPVTLELSEVEPNVRLDLWLGQEALAGVVKFMADTTSVTSLRVATRILGDAAMLTVEDDGDKPSASELASMFTPFSKVKGRPSHGLSLTKLAFLAGQSRGHVAAVGRDPTGLRLVLTLPLADAPGL